MQLKITRINGTEVTLKDSNGKTEKMDIFELTDLSEGDTVTVNLGGKETECTIDRFEDNGKAVLELVQEDGSIKTFDMDVREVAGIHIGQIVKQRVLAEFAP